MIKPLIASLFALFAGVAVTTLKKDKEILKLQKRIAQLDSYERFSDTFQSGWDAGFRQGKHRQLMDTIIINKSDLN